MLSEMWSEADLAYNRRGEVSPGQRRALGRRWGRRLGLYLVSSAAIITAIRERAQRIGGHEIPTLARVHDLWTKEVAAYVLPRVKLVIAIEKR